MKKFSIFLLTIIAFVGFTSCEHDDDVVFVAQPDADGISFVNSTAATYTLTNQTGSNIAERFVWSEVEFDAPTTVTYELQGSTTSDFSNADIIGTTSENNLAVTVSQMMSLAADAGLDNDPTTEEAPNTGSIFFQVRAYAGTDGSNGLNATSEPISVNVTLPEAAEEGEPAKMDLFLVGDATPTGWDNTATSNNYPLFRDSANDNIYYYTGKFTAGGVKVIEQRGAWAPQYGGENGSLIYRATEADPDPSPITVDSEAYYTFTINIEEMTYSLEPYDASAATEYDQIGLVGAGTTVGWPGDDNPTPDILLTQSSVDPHIWYTKDVELSEDGIKFRANLAWDVNWGGGENFPSGQATGDDIIVSSAGTYNVWFNDLTGRYIFIPVGEE
ncbi:SusF/SusE family outer membrane protein [Christiangramia sediminis]|uniref:SusF/SusE family outer membrane protein n=1 Tax=Christiangramia sediminis TaxID=2881336 RepID=A0A9X1RXW7_9FLAO|nr:SusF/SusE family outer membrane protein [Christiangramia sediminis]MCB7480725.1 SusF/SusE family outer membrane protein [Christiangramia sediminis]